MDNGGNQDDFQLFEKSERYSGSTGSNSSTLHLILNELLDANGHTDKVKSMIKAKQLGEPLDKGFLSTFAKEIRLKLDTDERTKDSSGEQKRWRVYAGDFCASFELYESEQYFSYETKIGSFILQLI